MARAIRVFARIGKIVSVALLKSRSPRRTDVKPQDQTCALFHAPQTITRTGKQSLRPQQGIFIEAAAPNGILCWGETPYAQQLRVSGNSIRCVQTAIVA
jgi:hypothetical protein